VGTRYILFALAAFLPFLITPHSTKADFFSFSDTPDGVVVTATGFLQSPFTLNNTYVIFGINQSYTLPEGQSIVFAGTQQNASTPETFSAQYEVVSVDAPDVPLAELNLFGQAQGNNEEISGVYAGVSNPALPSTVPAGAIVLIGNPSAVQTIGDLTNTIQFQIAVPEPASIGILCLGLLGLAGRRVRA